MLNFGDFNIHSNVYYKNRVKMAKFKCKICGEEKEAPYYKMKDNSKNDNKHSKSCNIHNRRQAIRFYND